MSDYYRNICYKTMKLKSKRKHLTSKSHLKLSITSVLSVMKKTVFMLLDNVVINVFVSNVIKIKVMLIY